MSEKADRYHPASERIAVVVERTRVSSDGANVQVTELHLSNAARKALNLPPAPPPTPKPSTRK